MIRNFPTPHCHSASSLDTASTPEKFADWELEHETTALTVTDHGTLAGTRKIYDLLKGDKYKGKVNPILGLEAYFRDDDCEVLKQFDIKQQPRYHNEANTKFKDQEEYDKLEEDSKANWFLENSTAYYQKYYHLTMHFLDQNAYEKGIKILSKAEFTRNEKHGSEFKPLFNWDDLAEIGSTNTCFCTGCLIGMIQRHVAFGQRYDIAEAYLKKILTIVKPENLYVEVFPHVCDRNWSSKVTIFTEDGNKIDVPSWRKLRTDKKYGKSDNISAEDLFAAWGRNKEAHGKLRGVMYDRKIQEIENPSNIVDVQFVEEFIQNECSAWSPNGDLQKPSNEFMLAMADKYKLPVLISDDSHFVSPDEKIVQDIKLMQDGDWRFHTSYHRLTGEEAFKYFRDVLGKDEKWFEATVDNNFQWASRFKDFKLKPRPSLPTSFYPSNTLGHIWTLIQKHGRAKLLANPEYTDRFKEEIKLLHQNGTIDLLPYFFIDEEVVNEYTARGEITGAGRGSAAGLLLAYLLELTHVDPIKFKLSKDRFLTIDRIQSGKLPDIDQDLPHVDILFDPDSPQKGWLNDRFGKCWAQISTDTSIKLKSAVLDVHRVTSADRRVAKEVSDLSARFQIPPQGISDRDFVYGYDANGEWQTGSIETDPYLIEYIKKYPKEWAIVDQCLGIPKGKGRHPCGVVITDEPVDNFIPLLNQHKHRVTAFTASQVESAGGLKMDFLRLKALQQIKHCVRLVQEQFAPELAAMQVGSRIEIDNKMVPVQRVLPFKGKLYDIWDLPEDQSVFMDICEGNTESVFQFGTPGAKKWLKNFNYWKVPNERKALDSIEAIAAFTALDRPGPLDAYVTDPATGKPHNMLVEFARRARGENAIGLQHPILLTLFPETYGILCIKKDSEVWTDRGPVRIQDVKIGQRVITEDGSMCNVSDVMFKGLKDTIKIRLSSGEELKLTKDHKVLTQHGWVEAQKLTRYHLIKQHWPTVKPEFNIGTDKDWLIGLLIADGNLCSTTPEVSCSDLKFANRVVEIAKRAFSEIETTVYFRGDSAKGCWHVRFSSGPKGPVYNSNPITKQLRELGLWGMDFSEKFLPESATLNMVSGIFEGDGCVQNRRIRVKNEKLARGVFNFLQKAHIVSSLYEDEPGVWVVVIVDDIPLKIKIWGNKVRKSDFVPAPKGKISRSDNDRSFLKKKICSRTVAERLAQRYSDLDIDLSRWGRVISIRPDAQKCEVFDLSVDDKHSFVVGGSVVHNCYQEQLQQTFFEIGKTTALQADAFRIHVGKKQMKKVYADKAIFMPGAIQSVGETAAEALWASMETAGQYSFNKSHAVSYATDGWVTAFLKHHFPTHWWCSVLSYSKKEDIQEKYWNQCNKLLLMPDVSKSSDKFQVEGEFIRAPLSLITGVGPTAHEEIMKHTPITSLEDLAVKIKNHKETSEKKRSAIHSGITTALIAGGTMDSLFGPDLTVAEKLSKWITIKAKINGTIHKKTGLPKEIVDPRFRNLNDFQQYQLKKQVLPLASADLSPMLTTNHGLVPGLQARKIGGNWLWVFDDETLRNEYYLTGRVLLEEVCKPTFSWPNSNRNGINLAAVGYVLEQEKKYSKTDGSPRISVSVDINGFILKTVVWRDKQSQKFPEPWNSGNLVGSIIFMALRKWSPDRDIGLDHTIVLASPFDIKEQSKKEVSNDQNTT